MFLRVCPATESSSLLRSAAYFTLTWNADCAPDVSDDHAVSRALFHLSQVHYLEEPCSDYVVTAVETAVELHREGLPGDILIFLTGGQLCSLLHPQLKDTAMLQLMTMLSQLIGAWSWHLASPSSLSAFPPETCAVRHHADACSLMTLFGMGHLLQANAIVALC